MSKKETLVSERNSLVIQARSIMDNSASTADQLSQAEVMITNAEAKGKEIQNIINLENIENKIQTDIESIQNAQGATEAPLLGGDKLGGADYLNSFVGLCSKGPQALLDKSIMNVMEVGTDANGGYTVPTKLNAVIIKILEELNVMRRVGRKIRTNSTEEFTIEDAVGAAAWTAENASYTENTPTFLRKTIGAHKATSLIKISEELLQDNISNLVEYIGYAFGKQFGILEEVAMTSGDGVGKPRGILLDAEAGLISAAVGAVTFDDLKDLLYSVKTPYRNRGKFMMNSDSARVLSKIKDTTGNYIWQPAVTAGTPDMLLGKTIEYNDQFADIATAAVPVIFGDLSEYIIADRKGRTMKVLNELFAVNGQVGYTGMERVDGKLLVTEAVKKLTVQ